jgi:hypothetical protein
MQWQSSSKDDGHHLFVTEQGQDNLLVLATINVVLANMANFAMTVYDHE